MAMVPIDAWLNDSPPFGAEDLEVAAWFPKGMDQHRISVVPGTTHQLMNQLVIFAAVTGTGGLLNQTLKTKFAMHWPGNVIVAKRAQKDNYTIVHLQAHEMQLVNAVVYQ